MVRDMKPVVVKRIINAISKRAGINQKLPNLKFQDLNILLAEFCHRLEQQLDIISRDSLPKPDKIDALTTDYSHGPSDLVTASQLFEMLKKEQNFYLGCQAVMQLSKSLRMYLIGFKYEEEFLSYSDKCGILNLLIKAD